jgi:pimeloyl-ACP methyl ester carboxylesterase
MTNSPVPGVTLKTVKANNIHMRYAEIGSGPLVLFAHGWPESWYSWRHQFAPLVAAGYRVVALDQRATAAATSQRTSPRTPCCTWPATSSA